VAACEPIDPRVRLAISQWPDRLRGEQPPTGGHVIRRAVALSELADAQEERTRKSAGRGACSAGGGGAAGADR
jgi:hypothetical protein